MKFNQMLEKLMDKKGVSAYKVWKDTGIPQSAISRWRAGTTMPSSDNIEILAKYFGVSSDELLGIKKPAANSDGKSELDIKLMQALPKMTDMEKRLLLERIDTLLELRGLK